MREGHVGASSLSIYIAYPFFMGPHVSCLWRWVHVALSPLVSSLCGCMVVPRAAVHVSAVPEGALCM